MTNFLSGINVRAIAVALAVGLPTIAGAQYIANSPARSNCVRVYAAQGDLAGLVRCGDISHAVDVF